MAGHSAARRSADDDHEKSPLGRAAQRRAAAQAATITAATAAPNIRSLADCTEDARQAALDSDPGPADPTDFSQLRGRLESARDKFPPLYREEFVEPFIDRLDRLGATGFTTILLRDPQRRRQAGLMLDMCHAVLQRSERFQLDAANAFQEVVGDLYDGFLSAEDRQGVKPPDRGTTAPLVKWGNPDDGPYTWPVDSTATLGGQCGVVNLPPSNARNGLLAWAALGHETAGHDILHADIGLEQEISKAVRKHLLPLGADLSDYWSTRIDETASDVMGILNMGPAAGIGLIGYFRGLNKAGNGQAVLRNAGPADDPHPADIVRGYLAAETVALLPFSQSAAWAKIIADETDKDVRTIRLGGKVVSKADARDSARRVAETIATTKMEALENHAIGEIQTWRDSDEQKVAVARQVLTTVNDLPQLDGSARIFATHVVAAAVMEALANGNEIPVVFDRMLTVLGKLHAQNPVWGPLFVRHPGDIRRDFVYIRQRRSVIVQDAEDDDVRPAA